MDERWSLLGSSPGPGTLGSFRLRLIPTAERRRSETDGLPVVRGELRDDWRDRDRSAAFIVAAAASDMLEERGEGDRPCPPSGVGGKFRCWSGEDEVEREGGRELRSGGMVNGWSVSNWRESREIQALSLKLKLKLDHLDFSRRFGAWRHRRGCSREAGDVMSARVWTASNAACLTSPKHGPSAQIIPP